MKKLFLSLMFTTIPFAYGMDGGAQSAIQETNRNVELITQFEYIC